MSLFALVFGGVIVDIQPAIFPVHEDFVFTTDISTLDPQPQFGWAAALVDGTWNFTAPPAPPAPTFAQQALIALGAGLAITNTGDEALPLSGTVFPTDPVTTQKIGLVITTLTATQAFPGGATSFPMQDASGTWHIMTPKQYLIVAGALSSYVAALDLIASGNPLGATELPPASITLTT
jgi:hypothetical protein